MKIAVQGDGVAACCCAYLLNESGFPVDSLGANRTGVPALMVSSRTQSLLAGVFRRDDLFVGFPRIESRIVAWGREAAPRRFPHSAVVVSEHELVERLGAGLANRTAEEPDWTIFASRPLPTPVREHRFGSRIAAVHPVILLPQAAPGSCWIESLSEGWLFLLPGLRDEGWLLAVGGPAESLLGTSRLVFGQIASVGAVAGHFPAYPALADPFCGPKWLACGSAALAFDPLCGDGAGNAVRESILAAAVIRSVQAGAAEEELRQHYRRRLSAGFLRHLALCREFYGTGYGGPWWDAEVALIDQGIDFCQQEIENAPPFRYRLEGYELHPV